MQQWTAAASSQSYRHERVPFMQLQYCGSWHCGHELDSESCANFVCQNRKISLCEAHSTDNEALSSCRQS